MIFAVQSQHYYEFDDGNPYSNFTKQVEGFVVDRRTSDDPSKIPYYQMNPDMIQTEWYGRGERHRVENGRIARDLPLKLAIMNCNSLSDLDVFINEINETIRIDNTYDYRVGEEYIRRIMILDESY